MMINKISAILSVFALLIVLLQSSCKDDEQETPSVAMQLSFVRVGTYSLDLNNFSNNLAAPYDKPILGSFSASLNEASVNEDVILTEKVSGTAIPLTFSFLDNNKTFSAAPAQPLKSNLAYVLTIKNTLKGEAGETFPGFVVEFSTAPGQLLITSIKVNSTEIFTTPRPSGVAVNGASFEVTFSHPLDPATITAQNFRISGSTTVAVEVTASNDNKTVTITPLQELADLRRHQLIIDGNVQGNELEDFIQYAKVFYSGTGDTNDFPLIGDNELLTLLQQQTFKYFWDFAQPNSGMARERNSSGDLVTSGGSGFGLMAIIVGIERNFITREQGTERLSKILDFLEEADRFHGVWSHWINGSTGTVIPFSPNDNGGDLVETSFLVQGLITFRQYLDPLDATEKALIDRINVLWQGVEWDWYTRGGQDILYWHWSPDKEWTMNLPIRGHNETLITYVLAASSPTHTISKNVYTNGYARNGGMKSGKSFYSIQLPLGEDYGGPMFFSHYSFLGLDPRNLEDEHANYWVQNVNHAKINHAYSVANPKGFVGYSDENWGLTASDNHIGYSAHSPLNDLGVISPTAALASFPYTPDESMKALKFFYYKLGDRLWGPYGFYDAFNLTEGWTANSFLAIDQGPIIVMVENHRTGLLWDLFMSAPEVQAGLTKLGFTY